MVSNALALRLKTLKSRRYGRTATAIKIGAQRAGVVAPQAAGSELRAFLMAAQRQEPKVTLMIQTLYEPAVGVNDDGGI